MSKAREILNKINEEKLSAKDAEGRTLSSDGKTHRLINKSDIAISLIALGGAFPGGNQTKSDGVDAAIKKSFKAAKGDSSKFASELSKELKIKFSAGGK
jgi:hypothetical protein